MRNTYIPLALVSLALLACDPIPEQTSRAATEMVDVTLVWPLPEALDDLAGQGFLTAATAGSEGVVFPRATFDALEPLTRVDEPDDLYANLVVVAARLDPCFQEGTGAPPCQPNVRLVLQPIRPPVDDLSGAPEARDASLHTFYPASEAEVLDAVAALTALRSDAGLDGAGALDVHPLLNSAEGRRAVAEVLLPLLGEGRLSRVTFIGVHGNNAAWTFGGFDLDASLTMTPIEIPESGASVEQHALSEGGTEHMKASVIPALAAGDNISILLDEDVASTVSLDERQAAFDAAARIENPRLHNPGTIDCVSCHMTAVVRHAALERESLSPSPDAFTSERHDLTPSAAFVNTQVVRVLGYRLDTLILAPRVVHESAAVADLVEEKLAARE